MSSLLYAVTILPLELAYKYLYIFLAEILGNYGTALIGLSIVSSILFVPLKHMAMAMQNREAALQKVMAPQLEAIKRESRGRERQDRIRALYRRYAYNPLMAMRSSVGILLQVPFLCAAYYMISSFAPIQGLAWGPIPDLGKPDGLLGGIHALPLLMTACNLGALYSASGFTRRDHLQGVVVAALFLALLYAAPSALLIYWTGNNALVLAGTVWHRLVPAKFADFARSLYVQNRSFATFTEAGKKGLQEGFGLASLYHALSARGEGGLYALAALTVGLLVLVSSPLALYFSDPEFFHLPAWDIMEAMLPYLMLWLLLCAAVRVAAPVPARPVLTFLLQLATLTALVYSTLLTGDYGAISSALLERAANLGKGSYAVIDCAVVLGLALLLLAVFHFRQGGKLAVVLTAAALYLGGDAAWQVFRDTRAYQMTETGERTAPVIAGSEFFNLSKTEPNVLIFFLDMFTGGHMEELFREDPILRKRLDGFTWYPDTLSIGFATSFAAPSLFGGPEFAPGKLNQRPDVTLNEKFTEALAVLPRNFGAKGFDTGILHPLYPLNLAVLERETNGKMPRIVGKQDMAGIRQEWGRIIGLPDVGVHREYFPDFLFSVGLFKAVPHAVKPAVYRNGAWLHNASRSLVGADMALVLYESAVLGQLPRMFRAEASRPTLRILYSMLPHLSWHLAKDSLVPVEDPYPATEKQQTRIKGVVPEHVYSELHAMTMLADFFDWLRREGAYDNTMIIVVSDHDEADSAQLRSALGLPVDGPHDRDADDPYEYPGRPHALLLVKPFADNGPFRVRNDLMTPMDVPAIACRAIGGCPDIAEPYTGPGRVREHYFDTDWRQIEVKGRTVYSPAKRATVRGTMFHKENWTIPRE